MEEVNNTAVPKSVLVVDDDDNLNTVLVDKLNIAGYVATGAKDGQDGLNKALAMHPDLIMLDLIMPKMDGLKVLAELRKDPWGKHARVMVLTVLENAEYVAEAMQNGVFGYLVKTNYSLDDMIRQVEEAFKTTA